METTIGKDTLRGAMKTGLAPTLVGLIRQDQTFEAISAVLKHSGILEKGMELTTSFALGLEKNEGGTQRIRIKAPTPTKAYQVCKQSM